MSSRKSLRNVVAIELAADLCQLAASNHVLPSTAAFHAGISIDAPAYCLANLMVDRVRTARRDLSVVEQFAEAECLLRIGGRRAIA